MAKVIHIYPLGEDLVTAFAERMCELIKQSNNPRAEMNAIESYLDEEGLWFGSFMNPPTPEHFVFNIIEENSYMREALIAARVIYTPKRIETIGDLLAHLASFK
jgi:hypothetical protein